MSHPIAGEHRDPFDPDRNGSMTRIVRGMVAPHPDAANGRMALPGRSEWPAGPTVDDGGGRGPEA